jgi:mono/diheme cytochrome c family protein
MGVATAAACAPASSGEETGSESSRIQHNGSQYFLTEYEGINGDTGYASGDPHTIGEWKALYMPPTEPVVKAFYRNARDLGFWRQMSCTKRFVRGGVGGCAVTNYTRSDEPDLGLPDLGTVTMNVTANGYVHFAVYTPQANPTNGVITSQAILDHDGAPTGKTAPQVCINCHGGTADTRLSGDTDLGAVFREFEPSLYELRPGISKADAEEEFYQLNQAILAANATLRSEADGAVFGVDHARQAVAAHVADVYDGLGEPSSHTHGPFSKRYDDTSLMPPTWAAADENTHEMWKKVVSGYCMGCHRINEIDFSSYANFATLQRKVDGKARLLSYLADDGRVLPPATATQRPSQLTSLAPYMPQAELTYLELENDADAQRAIAAWTH